jgi:hypothetical protein
MENQEHRKRQYAIHTLALGDGDAPGAASLFDTALTNGMLAVVAAEWPGEELQGRATLSASKLIDLVISKTGTSDWFIALDDGLPLPKSTPRRITVDLGLLRQTLTQTQPVRHGRPGGTEVVGQAVVLALRHLDEHYALGVLHEENINQAEVTAAGVRAFETLRVARYIDLVGDEELERRAQQAKDALPCDPKERSVHLGLGDCPMCGYVSLVVEAELRYGTQLGTCVACSFVHTEEISDDEEFSRMLEYHAGE